MLARSASAITPIEIDGRYFVNSETGENFWIKGVDYQPGGSAGFKDGSDPLSDPNVCARDIYLFQNLGINTLRIYSVDPTLDHDECVTLLASAGIYLFIDVNTPNYTQSLNRDEPWTTYTESYLSRVFQVVEAFSGYNNTLGYFAGNEVIDDATSAEASPNYVKAVVRDIKEYISNHIKRSIPVGYSAADNLAYRVSLANYLEAGPAETAVDFYGVNSYQWCGENTFTGSGYDVLVDDFKNYTIPIFLSEFGCNLVQPRTFQEVGSIFSDNFTVVFSGGLVYEYSEEASNYGLVNISDTDNSAQIRDDYVALSSRYATASSTGLATSSAASARPTSYLSSYANINGNTTLPDTLAADLIANGLDSSYNRGRYVKITTKTTNFTILDQNGSEISNPTVEEIYSISISDDSAIDQTDSSTPSSASAGSDTATATSTGSSTDSTGSTGTNTTTGASAATSSHSAALGDIANINSGLMLSLACIVGFFTL
ncbi:Glucanosyltransferase-domain-containing protein [Lipomyces japonicus]|uniref:Glucanosyltransferase-domain-containing protein n=1 Tax=Lipomyces japonicus TaxID=56871 RepID=UPI0034CE740C